MEREVLFEIIRYGDGAITIEGIDCYVSDAFWEEVLKMLAPDNNDKNREPSFIKKRAEITEIIKNGLRKQSELYKMAFRHGYKTAYEVACDVGEPVPMEDMDK